MSPRSPSSMDCVNQTASSHSWSLSGHCVRCSHGRSPPSGRPPVAVRRAVGGTTPCSAANTRPSGDPLGRQGLQEPARGRPAKLGRRSGTCIDGRRCGCSRRTSGRADAGNLAEHGGEVLRILLAVRDCPSRRVICATSRPPWNSVIRRFTPAASKTRMSYAGTSRGCYCGTRRLLDEFVVVGQDRATLARVEVLVAWKLKQP